MDLEQQKIRRPDGKEAGFEIEAFRRHCLLHGLDDIGLTLEQADAIRKFEQGWRVKSPWLFDTFSQEGV